LQLDGYGTLVKLTRAEVRLAEEIAKARWAPKLEAGYDHTASKRHTSVTNLVGVLGEIAFVRYYNLPLTLIPEPEKVRDPGHDVVLNDGRRVEVKTTSMWGADSMQVFPKDAAKLTRVGTEIIAAARLSRRDRSAVEMVGWAPWGAVANWLKGKEPHAPQPGWTPAYWIPYSKLRRPETLQGGP